MAIYQKVFPILFLSKGQEYKTLASIKDDDILSHGTGFFISEDGDFMSVGHNFHREKNNKKTYEVADFYAVLYEEETEQPHLKEIDFNKVQVTYIPPEIAEGHSTEFYEGKDIAIGKIDLQETDTVKNLIRVNFELQIDPKKELSMFGYLQDKWIIENDNKPIPRETIANTTFYYHELKNRRLSKIGTHILRIDDGEQKFKGLLILKSRTYEGFSGSPVFDDENNLVGIYYGADEVEKSGDKKEDNSNKVESFETTKSEKFIDIDDYDEGNSELPEFDYTPPPLKLVSVKNPHLKRIYNRFYHKLFVKATQSIKGYIKKGKEYEMLWERGEHCREGEEFVKDDSGDKMTPICFTYEIKENNG